MSALMNPAPPSRPPAGRVPSVTTPTSPQTNIPVPDYPVGGAGYTPSRNPHYFEKPELQSQYQTPQTPKAQQGSSSKQNSPIERRNSKHSTNNIPIPDTRGNQPSGKPQPVDKTPIQSQQQNLFGQPPSKTQSNMAGGTTTQPGPSNVNMNRGGASGTGLGGSGFGPGGFGTAGGSGGTGTGPGGVGGSSGPAGGAGGGPSDTRQQRRPSESTRGPRLLTATGNQPNSSVSAATTASPFPHAFERWEMLSSQWEGLTRYWNRRLEQHQEEISRDPLAVQMSRNITDLSAAGANLFHAVVELQRLRAASERKFQRWFFETKADQERSREMTSELENTLRNERQKRADAMVKITKLEKDKATAEKLVEEVRRELQISREEARRAWEELGRREQEERERTNSLRGGHPTLVGGVQVLPMPMPGVPNRSGGGGGGTASSRPRTSTSGSGVAPSSHHPVTAATVQPVTQPTGPTGDVVHPASPQFSHDDAYGEEDAYVGQRDDGYHAPSLHHEPHLPEVPSPPPMGGQTLPPHTPVSPYGPPQTGGYQQAPQSHNLHPHDPRGAEAFYQQPQPYLHNVPERTFSPGEESFVSEPGRPSSQLSVEISDPGSDDDEDPWARDEHGRVFKDEQGRAMTQSQLEHRRAQTAAYHQSQPYQYYPPADQQQFLQQQQQAPPAPQPGTPGYGLGWEGVPRHHHPTRLSEIMEEEERTDLSTDEDRMHSHRK